MGRKQNTELDYIQVYQISKKDSYVYNTCDELEKPEQSIEKQCINKDAYEHLSTEARSIIDIIVESPAEILELIFTPTTGKLSKEAKEKLFWFFNRKFKKKTKKIFNEITDWTDGL